MQKLSLDALARELLSRATDSDLLIIPDAPHSLTALAHSAVLLTVVKEQSH